MTAVGVNSSYGRISMSLRTEQEDTPLQRKLNVLADGIAKVGGGAALLLFVVLFIKFCAQLPTNTATPAEKGQEFLELFIVSVTVLVVAVPEGLPLAVTLALGLCDHAHDEGQQLGPRPQGLRDHGERHDRVLGQGQAP